MNRWVWDNGERYLQGKTAVLEGKPVPAPLHPPQIARGIARSWATWAM